MSQSDTEKTFSDKKPNAAQKRNMNIGHFSSSNGDSLEI
jgi:hypothetical protein